MVDKIISTGEKENIKGDEKSLEFARPFIKKQIKALIAKDLFSMSEYFQMMNSDDESILKAVEVINSKGEYDKILNGE
jgi:carboxyl-terminal processing protease